ncbi:MAG: cobalamin B12-binding domain-containing protein [Deltaproteobacteria bacterium]|nr:cobalamin B12-binding domain-containing protein [Deltaproteobacteria bacterium]
MPAPFEPGRLGLENVLWLSEPVALTTLAAMVPEHEVRILDMRLEEDLEYTRVLAEFRPQLVGTTSMTTDCYQAKALLHMAKGILGDSCVTIVGGHHPTLAPEDFEEPEVDAICLGEGEDTFKELVDHLRAGESVRTLSEIRGLRYRNSSNVWVSTPSRSQNRELDTFPPPARHLISKYHDEYFFAVAMPMASMATSRGCSFDCNFCAIWEFYERRTRYLSARAICDQLERMEEKFVFFLDDNFLTNRKRLEELADEIQRRGIKKWWGTQGRTDFIADNPETMKRLRDAGLVMVLSGYESNDESALEALLKRNTVEKNRRAIGILHELGIFATGIFMVRPEFEEKDFDVLYAHINELGVAMPIVTILTPLPGTQLYRAMRDKLVTDDVRLFDLLHAVLPTKIPRSLFYKKLAEANRTTWPSFERGTLAVLKRRPLFFLEARRGIQALVERVSRYRPIFESAESHLADEIGIISRTLTAGTAPVRAKLTVVDSSELDLPRSAV